MADDISVKLSQVRTMEDVVNLLSILFTNLNNQSEQYFDMFWNPVPMDLELEKYDENGELTKVIHPNVAKMRISSFSGVGNPNGKQAASIGSFYIDTSSRAIYYKAEGSDSFGWQLLWSTANLIEGVNFLSPAGNGSQLQNLNATSITSGILSVLRGGTGNNSISGLVKGNGTSPFTEAVVDQDYLAPSSFTGLIMSCPIEEIPTGWLVCDDTIYDISVRPELSRLCTKLGNKYGGDGITTFGVPNLIGKYVKFGTTEEVGTSEEGQVGEHEVRIEGSTNNDGGHTHNRGTMNITGNIWRGAAGWKTWGPSWDGCFAGSYSTETKPVQGGWDNDWGKFGNTFNFDASRSWSGETSSTPHIHTMDFSVTAGTGTNEVDRVVLVPIIKY